MSLSSSTTSKRGMAVGSCDSAWPMPRRYRAGIAAAFEQVYEKHQGIQAVTVYVPSKLDSAEADRIAQGLGAKLNKKVKLQQEVDPELIGGIKIRIGDNVIDGSVQAQLRLIRQDLLQAGRLQAAKAVGKA